MAKENRPLTLMERITPRYSWLPLILCVALNIFCFQITRLFTGSFVHYDLSLPIDGMIPIRPEWVVIYLTCFATWFFSYWLIARESKEKCYKFFSAEIIGKIICTIIFILLPTEMADRDALLTGDGFFVYALRFVYSVDAPNNLFPSLHCFASWFAWRGLLGCKKVPMWYKVVTFIYVPLVFLAVLFTKQHWFLDIVGGVAIAEIGVIIARLTRAWRMFEIGGNKRKLQRGAVVEETHESE